MLFLKKAKGDQWGTEKQREALMAQYELLVQQRQQRWTRYEQVYHAQQHYAAKYARAKRHWRHIRHHLHQETQMIQRMVEQEQWVTAEQHAMIHDSRHQWIQKLCHIREKLHEYQNRLLLLSQEIHTHAAHVIGMDRAFTHLQHEIDQLTRLKDWTPALPKDQARNQRAGISTSTTVAPRLTSPSSGPLPPPPPLQPTNTNASAASADMVVPRATSMANLPMALLEQRAHTKVHPSTVLHGTSMLCLLSK
ncbi:hypothetical protein BC940DRAFT_336125 [Gongronella butleri]|nr:hypothetical protein BC940DRAFT_336125 [Gongronella butleri]